jgi:hypothetical protein
MFDKGVIDWVTCVSSIDDDIIQSDDMAGWSVRVTERREARC